MRHSKSRLMLPLAIAAGLIAMPSFLGGVKTLGTADISTGKISPLDGWAGRNAKTAKPKPKCKYSAEELAYRRNRQQAKRSRRRDNAISADFYNPCVTDAQMYERHHYGCRRWTSA